MKFSALLSGCACALALSAPVSAQVLMLDFGLTTVQSPSLTSSPHHAATSGFNDTAWNKIQVADIAAGDLDWSDGTTATGISLNLGATGDATTRTLNLATVPSGNLALGNSVNTGLYTGTSVLTDGIFNGSSGNARAVGVQIGGLSAGTYDIYISGRNTNTAATYTQNFYAGASSTSGNFTFAESGSTTAASGYQTAALTFINATSAAFTWSQGGNYVKLSVSLTGGDVLNIAALGGATNEVRGFLNMIQVVNTSPIPEPSSFALLAGLLGLASAISLRRRR